MDAQRITTEFYLLAIRGNQKRESSRDGSGEFAEDGSWQLPGIGH